MTEHERLAVRRVLKMVDKFLATEKQSLLVTDGRGLMTWGEIRAHITAAISLLGSSRESAALARTQKKHAKGKA